MCAIIDSNSVHEVFGENRHQTGEKFFDWLCGKKGKGRLVVGGKLRGELHRGSQGFRGMAEELYASGKLRHISDEKVDAEMNKLDEQGLCNSDDSHIIALARVTGARLLYSNDKDLKDDFTNHNLINGPRGKVYSTRYMRNGNEVIKKYDRSAHGGLLKNPDMCCP